MARIKIFEERVVRTIAFDAVDLAAAEEYADYQKSVRGSTLTNANRVVNQALRDFLSQNVKADEFPTTKEALIILGKTKKTKKVKEKGVASNK
jgi:hypothetical protein